MIDVVFLVIIGLSALFGVFHGFTRIVVRTAAWIVAAWAAFEFGGYIAMKLSDQGAPTPTQTFGGYALIFVVTWVAIGIIGAILRSGVEAAELTGMDRLLGFVLGIIRGACLCSLLALVMSFTALTTEPEWRQSHTMAYIMPLTNWMRSQLTNWNLLKSEHLTLKPAVTQLGHEYGKLLRKELGQVAQKISQHTSEAKPAGSAKESMDNEHNAQRQDSASEHQTHH